MKICSACLLGIKCRYNGKSKLNKKILNLAKKEVLIPVCPEQLGGLATPRPSAEIKEDRVVTEKGEDVSKKFKKGAEEGLKIAKIFGAKEAILKSESPSCGCGEIYDGTFSGKLKKGDGIFCALLRKNGIEVKTEEEI